VAIVRPQRLSLSGFALLPCSPQQPGRPTTDARPLPTDPHRLHFGGAGNSPNTTFSVLSE
jgi:hypothetical protein